MSQELVFGAIVALGVAACPGMIAYSTLRALRGTAWHVPLWMAAAIIALCWTWSAVLAFAPYLGLANFRVLESGYEFLIRIAMQAPAFPLLVAVVVQRPKPFRFALRDLFILTALMALASGFIFAQLYPWLSR